MDQEVWGGGGQEVWTTPGKISNLLNSQSQIPKFRRHLRVFLTKFQWHESLYFTIH